jgi:hypothetical protein
MYHKTDNDKYFLIFFQIIEDFSSFLAKNRLNLFLFGANSVPVLEVNKSFFNK